MNSQKIALVGLFAALFAASAFIRIPFPVVPLTMQIFMVLLAPMLIGAKYSFAAVALYILLGLAGLPIFANGGGGIAYALQPTFGFLIGFLLSTIPCGFLSRNKVGYVPLFLSGLAALFTIYLVGVPGFWLSMNLAQGKEVSIYGAFITLLPFVGADMIKLTAAAFIARKIKPVFSKQNLGE